MSGQTPKTEAEADPYKPAAQRRMINLIYPSCRAAGLNQKMTTEIWLKLYEGVIKMFEFDDYPQSELTKLLDLVINACIEYHSQYPY